MPKVMTRKQRALKSKITVVSATDKFAEDVNVLETEIKKKRISTPEEDINEIQENELIAGSKKITSPKPFVDDESSDSSSNEFEQPDLSVLDIDKIKPKADSVDTFAAIEENILADVGRLSESDDESDFEDIVFVPSPKDTGIKNKTTSLTYKNIPSDKLKVEVKKDGVDKQEERSLKPSDKCNLKSTPKRRVKKKDGTGKHREKSQKPRDNSNLKSAPKRHEKGSSKRERKKIRKKEQEQDKTVIDVNMMDISQLLALGESVAESCKDKTISTFDDFSGSSEEDNVEEEDWVEVEGNEEGKQEEKLHTIPKEGVEITLDAPDLLHRKKKKGFDLEACLKRRLNRNRRQVQVLIHKVHLLCWIAHGRYINSILNSNVLMAYSLSLIPSKHCYPPNRMDLDYLEKIVEWFRKTIPIVSFDEIASNMMLEQSLEKQFQAKKACSKRNLVLLFIIMLRSLGVKARLVLSLQPSPLKPPTEELCTITPKNLNKIKNSKLTKELPPILEERPSSSIDQASTKVHVKGNSLSAEMKNVRPAATNANQKTNAKRKKEACQRKKRKSPAKIDTDTVLEPKKSRSQRNKSIHYKDDSSSDSDGAASPKRKFGTTEKKAARAKKNTSGDTKGKAPSREEDSDFEPEVLSIRKSKGISIDPKARKVLSSDSEGEEVASSSKTGKKKKEGIDIWTEVFLEMEEKWISVDVLQGKVHCVVELHAKATSPVLYVLAFGNDLTLKDVSRRYCPQWLSVTQKKRVDERWWKRTLRPYLPKNNAFNRREEEEMDEELESRPLPTNITEYKNHPLYALRRHLLKFEAIYPPDAPSVGFIRGEPVYSRDCVHQLHSRETWIKEAKLVRLGEQPYKIVKARPKYDRMSGKVVSDLPLELFGVWQVDDYIPPPAVDGKVPRNEYGNVDLYKPCMLPAGTVHLRLPGLNRVARKLGIDCVPAVTGFDFHSGGSHPTFDGFIVCEESKEILIEAWSQEQDEQEKRYREKRDKRVLGNWVRLVRGLLIRESLRHKYSFGEVEGESSSSEKKKNTKKKKKS